MVAQHRYGLAAECFWPGVSEADLEQLDQRVRRTADEDGDVRYLGSILMREDEVVLCLFEGPAEHVQRLAKQAGIPCERLLETSGSPSAWTGAAPDSESTAPKGDTQ